MTPLNSDQFSEKPATYEQALDNLTAENWHTERDLIEKRVAALERRLERADRQVMALAEALDQVGRDATSLAEVADKLRLEALQ